MLNRNRLKQVNKITNTKVVLSWETLSQIARARAYDAQMVY